MQVDLFITSFFYICVSFASIMAKGSYKKTNKTDFVIKNQSVRLKREMHNIARARMMSLSQLGRSLFLKARDEATPQERNYSEDE